MNLVVSNLKEHKKGKKSVRQSTNKSVSSKLK